MGLEMLFVGMNMIIEAVREAGEELTNPIDMTAYEPGHPTPWANPAAGGSANPGNWVRPRADEVRDPTDDSPNISEEPGKALAYIFDEIRHDPRDGKGWEPSRELAPSEVIGTIEVIAFRWLVGELGEAATAEHDSRTFVPVTRDYDTLTKAENDDCDLLAEDGTTLQVKTETTRPAPSKIGDADELWWVKRDGDEFETPTRIA